MKDYELIGKFLNELETVAADSTANFGWDSAPPVNTWGSADSTQVPTILIDDRERHQRIAQDNGPYAGVATDDQGKVLGAQLEFMWEATPEVVVRTGHETDTYKLVDSVRQSFYKLIRNISSYDVEWDEDVRGFDVGNPYNQEVNLDIPMADEQRAYTRALPFEVKYVDRIVYDGAEPIEKFVNNYHVSDEERGVTSEFTNTVDSTTP